MGEAVGILVAQSIGEPGNTTNYANFSYRRRILRDLTKQIRAPFTGTLKYNLKSNTSIVRTIAWKKGFELMEDTNLYIENETNTVCSC